MHRREFIALLGGAAAMWPLQARAQQKQVIIGFLGAGAAATSSTIVAALKQGLRENGMLEGKEYVLEQRWANGEYQRFPELAATLSNARSASSSSPPSPPPGRRSARPRPFRS
jgi:putative ABC transport system substrate-binding protein